MKRALLLFALLVATLVGGCGSSGVPRPDRPERPDRPARPDRPDRPEGGRDLWAPWGF